jgi:hypothetical protein
MSRYVGAYAALLLIAFLSRCWGSTSVLLLVIYAVRIDSQRNFKTKKKMHCATSQKIAG